MSSQPLGEVEMKCIPVMPIFWRCNGAWANVAMAGLIYPFRLRLFSKIRLQ